MIILPAIDPVAFTIPFTPLAVRWYALAYLAAFVLGQWWFNRLNSAPSPYGYITKEKVDSLLIYLVLGTVLGGRLGYVLFYGFPHLLDDPLSALRIWEGGMSFHGGFLGVILAALLFGKRHNVPYAQLGDRLACVAPIGLLLGRLANFVNSELWGRVVSPDSVAYQWAMIFPNDTTQLPRHPSQLYEAALEGLVLLAVINWLAWRKDAFHRPWLCTGVFIAGYGAARFMVEYVREPDALAHLKGGIYTVFTQGQLLSLPMVLVGLAVVVFALKRPRVAVAK